MKTILAFVVFCVGAEYHWNKKLDNGETISALCGACRDQKVQTALGKCWQKTGRCQYGCIDGWEGATDGDLNKITSDKGSMCDVPICDEGHCGAKGVCVGPNVCTCPELTSRDLETGGCYSLRVRGLQGAAISLAVIIVAITLCHVIQSNNSQKTA